MMIETADIGRYVEPVPQHHLDIVAAEFLEPNPRTVGQRPVTLDRQHLPAEPRQDGGLVARTGADFEHAVISL